MIGAITRLGDSLTEPKAGEIIKLPANARSAENTYLSVSLPGAPDFNFARLLLVLRAYRPRAK